MYRRSTLKTLFKTKNKPKASRFEEIGNERKERKKRT